MRNGGRVLTKPVVKPIVVTKLVQLFGKRKTGFGKERVVRLGKSQLFVDWLRPNREDSRFKQHSRFEFHRSWRICFHLQFYTTPVFARHPIHTALSQLSILGLSISTATTSTRTTQLSARPQRRSGRKRLQRKNMAGGLQKYRHLSRSSSHRQALLRNLVTSLFKNETISTTWPKAQEAQRLAEKLITLGKKNTDASKRKALSIFYVCRLLSSPLLIVSTVLEQLLMNSLTGTPLAHSQTLRSPP